MMLPEDNSVEGSTGGFGVTDQWIRLNENNKNMMPIIIALIIGYYFYA